MNKLLDLDKIGSILIILIMLVEIAIMLRAFMISTMLALGLWLLFHVLDHAIAKIHNKYFKN